MLDRVLGAIAERVEGVTAVVLLGADGVVVTEAGVRNGGGEVLAASYADLARKTRALHADVGLDAPREWVVGSESEWVVLREVTSEYLLLVSLGRGGSLGRARFEMRKAASLLVPELEA